MRPTPSHISQLKRYRVLRGPSQNRAAAADKRFGVALPESVMNLWAAVKAGPGLAYVYVYLTVALEDLSADCRRKLVAVGLGR